MHPEQAAFEKAIDANPMESHNHLAYADWLDENDQPEEAAFRRTMGNWHGLASIDDYEHETKTHTHDPYFNAWRIDPMYLPEGVDSSHLPGIIPHTYSLAADHINPVEYSTGRLGWHNYRSMEEAFRRAFREGQRSKQLQRKQKLARAMHKFYTR